MTVRRPLSPVAGGPTLPDVGLAAERTVLAWNRSGRAVVVCVAVLLRHVWPLRGADHEVALGLIGTAVIVWSVVFTAARSREKRVPPRPTGRVSSGVVASFAAP
jgi:hypothetical protein